MVFLACNWKMAPEKGTQALDLAKKTLKMAKAFKKDLSVVVCPPSIHISQVSKIARGTIALGAQDVSPNIDIPHTGLINAVMLKSYAVSYCIVGHSESRSRGQTNKDVADAVMNLLEKKITPIICIGEKTRDNQGWYLSEVKDQLEVVLAVVPDASLKKIIIAYEPVWAIGKDAAREATALECEEMVIFIRKMISDHANEKIASMIPILYGGSVDEKNAATYVNEAKVQGFLVGRISLEPKRLTALANAIVKK